MAKSESINNTNFLHALAVGAWFFIVAFGGVVGLVLLLYVIFYTKFYWLGLLYVAWMIYDKDSRDTGGRSSHWVRSWAWWRYYRDYFPLKLVKTVDLDPKKNYLFCSFPHGVLCIGAFGCFATEALEFSKKFPGISSHIVALGGQFLFPFSRDLGLHTGSVSSSPKSLNNILGNPSGGHAAVLIVGGAAESLYCRPGTYQILLNRRKGFIKLALEHGVPLVPVISFGETDLYDQVDNPEGSLLRRAQEKFRKMFGLAPVLPLGRFGFIPHQKPVTVVVGRPMEVQQEKSPSKELIEEVHKKFSKCLVEMFEEEKYKYLDDPKNTFLELI